MISAGRATLIWAPDPFGHYPEQEWASARLFEVESGDQGDLIVDLCCGWGRSHPACGRGRADIARSAATLVDRRRDPQECIMVISNSYKGDAIQADRPLHRFSRLGGDLILP